MTKCCRFPTVAVARIFRKNLAQVVTSGPSVIKAKDSRTRTPVIEVLSQPSKFLEIAILLSEINYLSAPHDVSKLSSFPAITSCVPPDDEEGREIFRGWLGRME